MIINMGGWGSPGKIVTVHVTPGTGAAVTCTNEKKTLSGTTDADGNAMFKLNKGVWSIRAEKEGTTRTLSVNITGDCTVELSLEQIPEFTYTGDYAIVGDDNNKITSSIKNWKIRFLTSGVLNISNLRGQSFDIFVVAGGQPGSVTSKWYDDGQQSYDTFSGHIGSGGASKTFKAVTLEENVNYSISIGGSNSPSMFGDSSMQASGTGNAVNEFHASEATPLTYASPGVLGNLSVTANTGNGGSVDKDFSVVSNTISTSGGSSGIVIIRNARG